MNRVPCRNNGKNTMHVGNVSIPPNETRLVDADLHPGNEARELEAVETAVEPSPEELQRARIEQLLEGSVDTITEGLETLSSDDLALAGALEAQGKARKSLLEPIAKLQLDRSNASIDSPNGTSDQGDETESESGESESEASE